MDVAWFDGKEGMVPAHFHIFTSVPVFAALSHDDFARIDILACRRKDNVGTSEQLNSESHLESFLGEALSLAWTTHRRTA